MVLHVYLIGAKAALIDRFGFFPEIHSCSVHGFCCCCRRNVAQECVEVIRAGFLTETVRYSIAATLTVSSTIG